MWCIRLTCTRYRFCAWPVSSILCDAEYGDAYGDDVSDVYAARYVYNVQAARCVCGISDVYDEYDVDAAEGV